MAHPDTERARGTSDRGVPKRLPGAKGAGSRPRRRYGPILTARGWKYPDWYGTKDLTVPWPRGEPKPFPREETPPPLPTLPPMPGQEGPGEDVATPPGRVPSAAKKRQARGARRRRKRRRAAGPAPSPPPAPPEGQQPAEPPPIVLPPINIYMGEAAERREAEASERFWLKTFPGLLWRRLSEAVPREEEHLREPPEWVLDERDPMDIYRRRRIGYTADQIRRDRAITDESRGTDHATTDETRGTKAPRKMTWPDVILFRARKMGLRGIGRLLPDPGPDRSTSPGVGGAGAGGGDRG